MSTDKIIHYKGKNKMGNQQSKILDPKVGNFSRAFFNVRKFNVTEEEEEQLDSAAPDRKPILYRSFYAGKNSSGQEIVTTNTDPALPNTCGVDVCFDNYQRYVTCAFKLKGALRQSQNMLEAAIGIRTANATVGSILDHLAALKESKSDLYSEVLGVTTDVQGETLIAAIAHVVYNLLIKKVDWHYFGEKRPKVLIIGCSPLVGTILAHLQGTDFERFRIHIVTTLDVRMKNKIVVSLSDPDFPAGHLYVGRFPIRGSVANKGTWDLEYSSGILHKHIFSQAPMGLVEYNEIPYQPSKDVLDKKVIFKV